MKQLFVNKTGLDHQQEWKNCQDFGFINEKIKCVVDGCSEGLHSEIGAKLFCYLFEQTYSVDESFQQLTALFPTFEAMKNHLLFTILYVEETEETFEVYTAGDGIIIKEQHDGNIEYDILDQNNSPSYYAYNFIEKNYLKMYQEGVVLQQISYSKEEYLNIGVATDGLSYLLNSLHKDEFERLLRDKKYNRIKLLINKINKEALTSVLSNQSYVKPTFLKDDLTIAF